MGRDNRIILIYPNYRGDIFRSFYLPVGLGYVAKSLNSAGIHYEVIDLNIDSSTDLFNRISEFNPQFIGISMMSYRCKETYKILYEVKHIFPKLKIIAGGPHVTVNREKILIECPAIDIAVVGEGEDTLVELMCGEPIVSIRGILYKEGEEIKFSGEREFFANLDKVPFPTYEGFKLEKYGRTRVLNSSRGCPYQCIFCGAPMILGKKWRKRSVEGMIEEFEYWYKEGYRNFYISDSNFGVEKKRVVEFSDEIINRDIDVTFTADGLRADHFDRFTLKKMREAGFTNLTFGVESGSEKVLRNLKKGETREQIESVIAAATDLQFCVTLFFLIGSPGEDIKDIKQSFELARKYDVADVYFFNLTPIPGTEFYDWLVKQGYEDEFKGRYPEDNIGFLDKAFFQTDVMTVRQLTRCIKQGRHIQRQVRWRYNIQKCLLRVTGKNIQTNNIFFNILTWIVSSPVFTRPLKPFWYMFKLVTFTLRMFHSTHKKGKKSNVRE